MENGPRYDWAAAAAAQICNTLAGGDMPKHILFGRILFIVLDAMNLAEEELAESRQTPSRN
ncbi:hypothetical protein [Singulisphaera sp. PoT]|uniref:hypothetical protein n=1 Tax=Singulisphaera sp. PoT TaxID=3411797 RepID=UPI003BF46B1B